MLCDSCEVLKDGMPFKRKQFVLHSEGAISSFQAFQALNLRRRSGQRCDGSWAGCNGPRDPSGPDLSGDVVVKTQWLICCWFPLELGIRSIGAWCFWGIQPWIGRRKRNNLKRGPAGISAEWFSLLLLAATKNWSHFSFCSSCCRLLEEPY